MQPSDVTGVIASITSGVAVSPLTPSSLGLTSGNSGAMTTFSVSGHQYLVVAARQKGVVVIDITNPSTPTVVEWPQITTTNFSGNDVGGVVVVSGGSAGHTQVFAFAYNSKHYVLLNAPMLATGNPATNYPAVVDSEGDLPIAATAPVTFSGGSAFVAGAIPYSGKGIYLAEADGYGLFDITTNTLSSTIYPVQASGMSIAENVGGDVAHGILLGGNYGGIQLVDLNKQQSYYMSASTFDAVYQTSSLEIDGDSVDAKLRVGIMDNEHTNAGDFINLAAITETNGSGAGALNTLSVNAGSAAVVVFGANLDLSGSAVDSTTDLALFGGDFSSNFVIAQLQDPGSVPAGTAWKAVTDWRFWTINNSPSLANYAPFSDPHGLGVVYNLKTRKTYGYMLDGDSNPVGIVQIDMTDLIKMAPQGTTGDALHTPSTDPAAAGVMNEIALP
jgi:hypothetical protein